MNRERSFLNECRYCSVVSKRSAEVTIGTASELDHWVAIALPTSRPRQIWLERPLLSPLNKLAKQVAIRRGQLLRLVAIASESTKFSPECVQVLHYYRLDRHFSSFLFSEYSLPEKEVVPLIQDIVQSPRSLSKFSRYRVKRDSDMRDLFVCTHTNYDLACGRYGTPLFKRLHSDYNSSDRLRIWQCSHFGGHRFAPTVMDFPSGHCWGHLNATELDNVLRVLIERQGDLQLLKPYYRGWAGTHKFGQFIECELWMQSGWDWLSYPRSARITRARLPKFRSFMWHLLRVVPGQRILKVRDSLARNAQQVEVELTYSSPDGVEHTCRALVEKDGSVSTAIRSDIEERVVLPQYRVDVVFDPTSSS